MTSLAALPQEILLHIVTYLDDVDQNEGSFAIFDALRVNRVFRNLALKIYFDKRPHSAVAAERHYWTRLARGEDAELDAKIMVMNRDERCYRWAHGVYGRYLACNPGRKKVEMKDRKYVSRREREIAEDTWG